MTDDEIATLCRTIAERRPKAAVVVLFLPDGGAYVQCAGDYGDGSADLRSIAAMALLNGPEAESDDAPGSR